jgi:ribosomal protein L37AE/L43A
MKREPIQQMAGMIVPPRRDAPVCCPICGRRTKRRSRQQVYCSRKCMRKGNYARKAADAFKKPARYPHCRDVPDAHKLENENNNLQRPKTESSPRRSVPPRSISSRGIVGPRHVIQVEIIDSRHWEEVTSSDGVRSYVSYIGKRALIDGGAK